MEELFVQNMVEDSITMTTIVGHNRRLSMVTILLASIAFLLVITSIAAFIYVFRKGNRFEWKKTRQKII